MTLRELAGNILATMSRSYSDGRCHKAMVGLTCIPGGRGDLRWRHAADDVVSVDNSHVPACEQQTFAYFCHVMLQLIATFGILAWHGRLIAANAPNATVCCAKSKATTDQCNLEEASRNLAHK
jgi:hypothetical protein